MKRQTATSLLALTLFVGLSTAAQAVELFDFGINIDGTTNCGLGPCDTDGLSDLSGISGVDDSLFDFVTGLGSIGVTIGGAGAHNVDLFLDHAIDQAINTFFNEFGATSGAPSAGQSWEIDEPGAVFGDIFVNFLASTLDNSNGVPSSSPDDVSMALGYDFTLGAGETALVNFLVGETAPSGGFFLSHTDPDSDETIYFSSTLSIEAVPEPTTVTFLGLGLAGIGFARRRAKA